MSDSFFKIDGRERRAATDQRSEQWEGRRKGTGERTEDPQKSSILLDYVILICNINTHNRGTGKDCDQQAMASTYLSQLSHRRSPLLAQPL